MSLFEPEITALTSCLCCGSTSLSLVLDLGTQPLANELLSSPSDSYKSYPLALNRCEQCGHGQLTHSVSPDILYKNYAYASGTSKTLNDYFEWFAQECVDLLPPGASVLEIACNDGSLLHQIDARGLFTYGIDPATNITAAITGLRIKNAMWPCPMDGSPYPHFDMVIAQNVLAHGPNPLEFLKAVRNVLADDGIAVIQTSQGRMLESGQLDNIYHEHHSFFTVSSMAWLAGRAGLRLRAVREVSVHGGSICWILDRPEDSEKSRDLDFLTTGEFAVNRETPKTGSAADYELFAYKARSKLEYIKHTISGYKQKRKFVAFVGYAAKAAVILHATGIIPDAIYDEAPLKIGKYVPGLNIPVQSLSEISKGGEEVVCVISAWNYRKEIETKVRTYREGKPAMFMVYMPDIEEWV